MSDDYKGMMQQVLGAMMQKYAMPMLNATVPAARADEGEWEYSEEPIPSQGDDQWEYSQEPIPSAAPNQANPTGATSAQAPDNPTDLLGASSNMGRGFRRGLANQAIGMQQIASDVARAVSGESGQPYSDYRQSVERERERLKTESDKATGAEWLGENVALPMAEFAAVPNPGRLLLRMPVNALTGAAFAGLQPTEHPTDRIPRAIEGAAIGGMAPELMGGGLAVGRSLRQYAGGLVNPSRAAAMEMQGGMRSMPTGGDGPPIVPPSATVPPFDGMGPPSPRYVGIDGIEPTAAMLSPDQRILQAEQSARVRNVGGQFSGRDDANKKAVYDGLANRALDQQTRKTMKRDLNAKTQPIKEEAFERIRQDPGDFAEPLDLYVRHIRTDPELQISPDNLTLANLAERALRPVFAHEAEALPSAAGRNVSRSVNPEKDDLITAIRKLGGIDKTRDPYWAEAMPFSANPVYGPVWRAADKYGTPQGRGFEDMALRLHEHGYLSHPDELEEVLYDASRGVIDPSRLLSRNRSDYDTLSRGAGSAEQDLLMKMDELITSLNAKNAPKPAAPKGDPDPAGFYGLRKLIDDKLNLNSLNPDELSKATKAARRVSVGIKGAIDEGMDRASDGLWSNYLRTHGEGMRPIEEGRAFQEVLDRFDTSARLADGETPELSASALRSADNKFSYTNLGESGFADKLSPEGRQIMNSAEQALTDIAKAKVGAKAAAGSPTASYIAAIINQSVPSGKTAMVSKVAMLLDAIGRSRGVKALDEALLNPEKLGPILEEFNRLKSGQGSPESVEVLRRITRVPFKKEK